MALKPYTEGAFGQVDQGRFGNNSDSPFFTGVFNGKELPVDPYISGYAFIKWLHVPAWVEDNEAFPGFKGMTEKNLRAFTGMDDIEIQTIALQNGFTPSELMFPGTVTMPNGFTMTHNEFSGSPVSSAYTYWASSIRDPETGLASYPAEYASKNHCGALLYVVTRPDAASKRKTIIEKAAYFSAVWPMKIALSQYNYTAGTNESPQVEITFAAQRHIGEQIEKYAADNITSLYDYAFSMANNVGVSKVHGGGGDNVESGGGGGGDGGGEG